LALDVLDRLVHLVHGVEQDFFGHTGQRNQAVADVWRYGRPDAASGTFSIATTPSSRQQDGAIGRLSG
jgi:hypothetical protein